MLYTSSQPGMLPSGLKLVDYPHKALLNPAESMEFTKENLEFCVNLLRFYFEARRKIGPGVVGLAAPQVGKSLKVFVAHGDIYINPEIIWLPKQGTETSTEGCLSLPLGMSWEIARPYSVAIKYQDLDGNYHEKKFNNLNARIVLHEIDHLHGKLCCGEDYSNVTNEND